MQRFFVDPESIQNEIGEIKNLSQIHQIQWVLRMKPGDQIILLDNTGFEYVVILQNFEKNRIDGKIIEKRKNENEPFRKVILYQALPKKLSLFELVLQKGTEIGVSEFVPLITQWTERRELPKLTRLRRVIQEAAEQSGRGFLPSLTAPLTFEAALKAAEGQSVLIGHISQDSIPLPQHIDDQEIHLFIGPEGGFSEEEIQLAKTNGAYLFRLTKTTLRTETAALVACSFILLS